MRLHKNILIFLFIISGYFINGQDNNISHTLILEEILNCDLEENPCDPINIYRKSVTDSISIFIKSRATVEDVSLFIFSEKSHIKLNDENAETHQLLIHGKTLNNEESLKINLTGLLNGLYYVQIFQGGSIGAIEINLKTETSDCINPIDTIDGITVFTFAEKMPKFVGGDAYLLKYLSENINYPSSVKQEELQFTIYVTFIIDSNGKVRNPCIINSLHSEKVTPIEKEIIRVIENMPCWTPGMNNEKPVSVRFYLPVRINWK